MSNTLSLQAEGVRCVKKATKMIAYSVFIQNPISHLKRLRTRHRLDSTFKMAASPSSQCLSGQVCLVTGASRGIGKGIALQLGEAGATVYITGM